MIKNKLTLAGLFLVIGATLIVSNPVETVAEENNVNVVVASSVTKDNYFIIPYSSSSYLTEADLQYLSLDELAIARNEIYARHGYQFQQQKFINYFNNQSWYVRSSTKVTTADLSQLEYANVTLIQKQEARVACNSYSYDRGYYYGNFVIPDSDVRKVSDDELRYLTTFELAVARNEIYARHGYIFVSNEWKDFFVNEYWYTPLAYSVTLNSIEEYNVARILKEEARR